MKGAVLWGGAFRVCGVCGSGGPGAGRTGRAPLGGPVPQGAAWGRMPGSRRTRTGCSAEQLECRSQARAVWRGRVAALRAACAQGGGGGCESGLGCEPLAGRARFVRGPHALGARGVPTAPPVALCRAPCFALSHCLPAAPPRAKRSAKMAENDDLTTEWGRFRQTEGRGELCDTRCESRDLGFCSPAFLTSARPCRQVVIFGHFSTRDYVRARRRARCGGRAARERRGAWRSAGRGRAAPILAAWRSRRDRVLVPFSSQAFYLAELKNDTAGIRRKDTQRLTTATRREGMITPTISNDGGCAKAPRRC